MEDSTTRSLLVEQFDRQMQIRPLTRTRHFSDSPPAFYVRHNYRKAGEVAERFQDFCTGTGGSENGKHVSQNGSANGKNFSQTDCPVKGVSFRTIEAEARMRRAKEGDTAPTADDILRELLADPPPQMQDQDGWITEAYDSWFRGHFPASSQWGPTVTELRQELRAMERDQMGKAERILSKHRARRASRG